MEVRSRWRKLDPTTQATLVLAFLRTNLTYPELAVANAISTATCRRIINEGIELLADRAIRLSGVVRLARKAGWEYLLIDGVNVPTVVFARRQRHYSGKHKRHGVNVQTICAPTAGCCGPRPPYPARPTTSPPPATTFQARSLTCSGCSTTWATSASTASPPGSAVPVADN
ncbi:hypothetical protein [Dactylosporangium sp. NPDC048998]|uniref:hypothetical protein n=1 Tax=Dactylosporangium sp. NPDC048998 TaxID=3363976 RepID=UPI00372107FF